MAFRVGQKVVRFARMAPSASISAARARSLGYTYPEIGEVITIKTLNVWPTQTILTFHEHDNSHIQRRLNALYEPGFDARAFRPLVERKTDISIFTEMLTKTPARARSALEKNGV